MSQQNQNKQIEKQQQQHFQQQWYAAHVASAANNTHQQNMNMFPGSAHFVGGNSGGGGIAGGVGPSGTGFGNRNAVYDLEMYANNAFGRSQQDHTLQQHHQQQQQQYNQQQQQLQLQLQRQQQQQHTHVQQQMQHLRQQQQHNLHIPQPPPPHPAAHHLMKVKSEPMDYNREHQEALLANFDLSHQHQQQQQMQVIQQQQHQFHHMPSFGQCQSSGLQQHFQTSQQRHQMQQQPQQTPTHQRHSVSQLLQSPHASTSGQPIVHPVHHHHQQQQKQHVLHHQQQQDIQHQHQHRILQQSHQELSQVQQKSLNEQQQQQQHHSLHSQNLAVTQQQQEKQQIPVQKVSQDQESSEKNMYQQNELLPQHDQKIQDQGVTSDVPEKHSAGGDEAKATTLPKSPTKTTTSIEPNVSIVNKVIIKSEPPEESNFNTASKVDLQNKKDSNEAMEMNPETTSQHSNIDLAIVKTEKMDDANLQQKPLNFPRRKLVQTERNETLPICQRCKQVFLKKHSYTKHVAQSACEMLEYDFKCSICPMSFRSMEELQSHEHLHRNNKFFCNKYCGKFFENIELCEAHEYMNHDYTTFVCNLCSANYDSRDLLFDHLQQHRNQERFDCPVCRLWYRTAQELHQHRLLAPSTCGKYFNAAKAAAAQVRSAFATGKLASSNASSGQKSKDSLQSFQVKDYRIGVKEAPKFKSPSPSPSTSSLSSSFNTQYAQQQSQRILHQQQQHARSSSSMSQDSSLFQLPHSTAASSSNSFKTEIKVEPDVYAGSEYSGLYNDYTNDSYASSHNSSFSNEYSDSNSIQASALMQFATLDDSEDALCCVPHCGVRKKTSPSIQFFGFPKDDKYIQKWVHNLKMFDTPPEDYLQYRICSMHFPKRCINRYALAHWAVPTFKLGHDDVANLYQNREVSTPYGMGEGALCSMPGCKSKRGESNQKFYNFPKEIKSLIKWCQNARLPVQSKEQRHFCSRHFEERCIGKFRLKPWAVPTLHLGTPYGKIHDNPKNIYIEEKRCCLPFCRRARSSDINMSLYRFPRDEVLLQRWCYNLRLDPNVYRGKNHKICSSHFIKEALGLRKLAPGAVPTLNLGHGDTFNIYENELYVPPPPPPPPPPSSHQTHYAKHSNKRSLLAAQLSYNHQSYDQSYYGDGEFMNSPFASTSNLTEFMDVCCVPGCTSKRHESENVTFHTMPRRQEQLNKWLHNLKLEPDKVHKGMRICSNHFEPFCIGGCMRPFAVPTLMLGHDDTDIYQNPAVIKKLNIRETCCVQTCKRNRDRHHANLHRFPSSPEMLQKWCENLQKPIPDGTKLFNDAICEVHFEDRCLRNKRLEKWAIPTLNLGHEDLMHVLPTDEDIALYWAKPPAPNIGDEEGECCVETCRRNPQVDDVKLYRTPEDSEVLAKWAHNLQIDSEDLTQLRICNLHFESHCIGKRLYGWAIPTLNLGKNIEHLYENPDFPPVKKEFKQKSFSEPAKPWTQRCCLPHCRKQRALHNVMLFRFPNLNRAMLAKWCHNAQLPMVSSQQRRICSTHFEQHVLTKKCPINDSVPTLDLNTPPGYKVYQNPSKLKAQKKKNPIRICMISSCRKSREDGVTLFRFPHKPQTLRKWFHNLRQKPKGSQRALLRICSEHFDPHSVLNKRLSPHAVPTLNLGHDENADDLYPNEQRAFVDEKCAVPGCDSTRDMPNVRLFKFPQDDEDQLWKWSNNLKMNPIDCHGARICNMHFEDDCMGPKNLYKWAIPTLRLGHDDADIELVKNPPAEERYTEIIFKCCVPTCGKTRKYDDAQMNSFPKNPKFFKRWKHNLKLDFLDFKRRENYKICNDHFEPVCLGKMRLNYGAIPTLNLGHDDKRNIYKVRPELLQVHLFGKSKPLFKPEDKQLELLERDDDDEPMDDVECDENADVDNDDDMVNESNSNYGEDDSILPDTHTDLSIKCIYPECSATKTLLREPYDMPAEADLFKLWCEKMSLNPNDVPTDSKLCGLHFMQLHNDLVPAMKLLENDENPSIKNALAELEQCFERSCNSLLLKSSRCSVSDCFTNVLTPYKLYQFPYNREIKAKWTYNTGIVLDEHRRHLHKVCQLHFEPHCLTDTLRLRPWAIPTLNLKHENPKSLHQNPDLNSMDRRLIGPITQKCCVSTCDEENDASLRLFTFPTEENLLTKWAHNLKLEREKCPLYKICSRHFERECIGKERLRAWALPTLNLGHDDTDIFELAETKELIVKKLELDVSNVKMKKSFDVAKCCVLSCRKSRLLHGVRLFKFPANSKMAKKWLHNLQLPSTEELQKDLQVCNLHFIKRCFQGKNLREWAIPTVSLGHNESIYECSKNLADGNEHVCSLEHCRRQTLTYRFPRDPTLLAKWCKNLQLDYSSVEPSEKICEDHFEEEVRLGNILMPGSVPTLHLGHDETPKYDNVKLLASKAEDSGEDMNELDLELMESVETSSGFILETKDGVVKDSTKNIKTEKYIDHSDYSMESTQKSPQKTRVPTSNAPVCCLKHCGKQKTATQHLSTFGFPKDPQLLQKWSENLKLPLDQCFGRVCIEHFELQVVGARKLRPGAVPTLQLGYEGKPRHLNHMNELNKDLSTSSSNLKSADTAKANDLGAADDDDDGENVAKKPRQDYNITENDDSVKSTTNPHYAEKLSHSVFRLCCLKHCRKRNRRELSPKPNDNEITSTAEGCEESPEAEKLSADSLSFRFPKEPELLQKWFDNLQLKDIRKLPNPRRLCSAHFESKAIDNSVLKPGVVPTLDLGEGIEPMHVNSEEVLNFTSTDETLNYCHVNNCKNSVNGGATTHLFKFPKSEEMQNAWCENLQLKYEEISRYRVCHLHFEKHCLNHMKLFKWAVPTLEVGHSEPLKHQNPPEVTENSFVSTQRCCLHSCQKTRQQHGVELYPFPNVNTLQARNWCHNTKIAIHQISQSRICSEHFVKSAMTNGRVRSWALPTLNLGHTDTIYENPTERLEHCCVENCESTELTKLFSFPKRSVMLRKWASNTGQNAYQVHKLSLKVCRKHFDDSCFNDQGELKADGVPTLNLNNEVVYQLDVKLDEDDDSAVQANCAVQQCGRTIKGDGIKLYQFPTDETMLVKWGHNLQMDLTNAASLSICNIHFESALISKHRLHEEAIPTKYLGHGIDDLKIHKPSSLVIAQNISASAAALVNCCVRNCNKSRQVDGVHLYRFPKQRPLALKWMYNLQLKLTTKQLNYFKVCELHFEPDCRGNFHLEPGALPTLSLGHTDENIYASEKEKTMPPLKASSVTTLRTAKHLRCAVTECLAANQLQLKFWALPVDSDLRAFWCALLQLDANEVTDSTQLCALHYVRAYELSAKESAHAEALKDLHGTYELLVKSTRVLLFCCSVPNCNLTIIDDVKLTKLPCNADMLKKWLHNTQIDFDEKRSYIYRVCSAHFEQRFLCYPRIPKWALPTLNLPHNESSLYENAPEEMEVEQISTNEPVEETSNTFDTVVSKEDEETEEMDLELSNEPLSLLSETNETNETFDTIESTKTTESSDTYFSNSFERVPEPEVELKIDVNESEDSFNSMPTTHNTNVEHSPLANSTVTALYEQQNQNQQNYKTKRLACAVEKCLAADALKMKLLSIPSDKTLQNIWSDILHLDKPTNESSTDESRFLCVLHFMRAYESSLIQYADLLLSLELNETYELLSKSMKLQKFRCSVPSCGLSLIDGVHLKELPDKPELVTKWLENTCIEYEDKRHHAYRICSMHFDSSLQMESDDVVPMFNLPSALSKYNDNEESEEEEEDDNELLDINEYSDEYEMSKNMYSTPPSSPPYLGRKFISTEPAQLASTPEPLLVTSLKYCKNQVCFVPNCTYASMLQIRCWGLPNDESLRQTWCELLNLDSENAGNSQICALHFMRAYRLSSEVESNLGALEELSGIFEALKKSTRLQMFSCSVPGCCTSMIDNIKLLKMTTDIDLLQKWLHNTGITTYDVKRRYMFRICALHFEPHCFGNTRLHKWALPTLNLPPNDHIYQNEVDASEIHDNTFAMQTIYKKEPKHKTYPPPYSMSALSTHSFHASHNQTTSFISPFSNKLKQCCVPNCGRSKLDHGVKLYKFPDAPETIGKWCHNFKLDLNNAQDKLVCSVHFDESCFKAGRLLLRAVPTLHLGHSDSAIYYSSPTKTEKHTPEDTLLSECPPSSPITCCISSCINASNVEPIKKPVDRMFEFCKDSKQLKKWLHNTGIEEANAYNSFICALHFEPACLMTKTLPKWAIPTLMLDHGDKTLYSLPEHIQNLRQKSEDEIRNGLEENNSNLSFDCNQSLKGFDASNNFEAKMVTEQNDNENSSHSHQNKYHDQISLMEIKVKQEIVDEHIEEEYQLNSEYYEEDGLDYDQEVEYSQDFEPEIKIKTEIFDGDQTENEVSTTTEVRYEPPKFEITQVTSQLSESVGVGENDEFFKKIKIKDEPKDDETDELYYENNDERNNALTPAYSQYDTNIATTPTLDVQLEIDHVEEYNESKGYDELSSRFYEDDNNEYDCTENNTEFDVINQRRCQIAGCPSSKDTPNITLHKFPAPEPMLKKWEHNTQVRVDRQHHWRYRICSRHFERTSYSGARLLLGTLPTLNLGPNRPAQIYQNEYAKNALPIVTPIITTLPSQMRSLVKTSNHSPSQAVKSANNILQHMGNFKPQTTIKSVGSMRVPKIPSTAELSSSVSTIGNKNDNTTNSFSKPQYAVFNKSFNSRKCRIEGCTSHAEMPGITLHKFPLPEDHFRKWVHNTGIQVDPTCRWRYRICSMHFEPGCLRGVRFMPGTMPTLNLGPNRPANIYPNECAVASALKNAITYPFMGKVKNEPRDVKFSLVPATSLTKQVKQENPSQSTVRAYNTSKQQQQKCSVPGCTTVSEDEFVKLYEFPEKKKMFKKWLHNTQLKVNETNRAQFRICSLHFEDECFGDGLELCYGSVPTLYLGRYAARWKHINVFGEDPNKTDTETSESEDEEQEKSTALPKVSIKSEKPTTPSVLERSTLDTPYDDGNLALSARCSIPTCQRERGVDGVSLHRLPQHESVLRKWIKNCRLDTKLLTSYHRPRICSIHFEKRCFVGIKQPTLQSGSVPTLHLGYDLPSENNDNNISNDFGMGDFAAAYNKVQSTDNMSNNLVEYEVAKDGQIITYNAIKSGYQKCSLIHCQKNLTVHGVKTYKFPKSAEQCEKWAHNLNIKYDATRPWKYLICSEHFEQCCFVTTDIKTSLTRWSVPTLNLGDNIPKVLFKNEPYGTNSEQDEDDPGEQKIETYDDDSIDDNQLLFEPTTFNKNCDDDGAYNTENEESSANNREIDQNEPNESWTPNDYNKVTFRQRHCCLPHCRAGRSPDLKLFRVPSDLKLLSKWEHNLGMKFRANERNMNRVCQRHFENNLIGVIRLLKGAIPTLDLGENAPTNLYRSENIGTTSHNDEIDDTIIRDDDMNVDFGGDGGTNDDAEMIECAVEMDLDEDYYFDKNSSDYDNQELDLDNDNAADSWSSCNLNAEPRKPLYKQIHCCLPHCGKRRVGNIKLFRIPRHPVLLAKWEHNLKYNFKLEERNISLVCSSHFQPHVIGAMRLLRNAIPTLNLGHNDPNIYRHSDSDFLKTTKTKAEKANISYEKQQSPLQRLLTKPEFGDDLSMSILQKVLNRPASSGERVKNPTLLLEPICCLPYCGSRGNQNGVFYFKFPQGDLYKKWCQILEINEDKYRNSDLTICSDHFTTSSYSGEYLKAFAIPTLNLCKKSNTQNTSVIKCCAANCMSTNREEIILYPFPDNKNLCAKWCHNLQIEQTSNKMHKNPKYRVCRIHFEESCLHNNKLHPEAVPTLNLGHDEENVFSNTCSFKTTASNDAVSLETTSMTTINRPKSQLNQFYSDYKMARQMLPSSTVLTLANNSSYQEMERDPIGNYDDDDDKFKSQHKKLEDPGEKQICEVANAVDKNRDDRTYDDRNIDDDDDQLLQF